VLRIAVRKPTGLLGIRSRRNVRSRLALCALLAFGLRALIPLGFMPAADGSFSLMICPDGMPAGFLPASNSVGMPGGMAMPGAMGSPLHQGHGHGDTDDGHCTFCAGFSAAPPLQLLAALFLLVASIVVITETIAAPASIGRIHIPQARAPPAPL